MMSFTGGVGDSSLDLALIACKSEQEMGNAWDSEILGAEMSKIVAGAFPDNHDNVLDIIDNSERVFRWGLYETPLRPTWISRGKKTMVIGKEISDKMNHNVTYLFIQSIPFY